MSQTQTQTKILLKSRVWNVSSFGDKSQILFILKMNKNFYKKSKLHQQNRPSDNCDNHLKSLVVKQKWCLPTERLPEHSKFTMLWNHLGDRSKSGELGA